jgi:hypothetical protein
MKSYQQAGKRVIITCCLLFALLLVISACDSSPAPVTKKQSHSFSTDSGTNISYYSGAQDVALRVMYGGGRLGTLEFSPNISVYGDGSYILGPGLSMREGQLTTSALEQLLHTLVDSDGLLAFTQQQFYDVPDQNATFLQLNLNGAHYSFEYGPFGNLSESAQQMDEYKRLGQALTSIQNALTGPVHPYKSNTVALLAHQDFSPDLTQTIPSWTLEDIDLANLAIYECGAIPQDITSPNADTGCLSYTTPHTALLLNAQQQQAINALFRNQQQAVFSENGLYYLAALRALLPDEQAQHSLAMLGSDELSIINIPLHAGPVPTPVPTA